MMKILIFLSLALSAFAAEIFDEPCPDVKPMENFNISAFSQGIWYEIARYPSVYEERADCVSYHFEPEGDLYKFKVTYIIDHQTKYMEGYMSSVPNANNAGLVNFSLSKNKDLSVVAYILDTDYENYQITYECLYDEMNKKRIEFAWIGSRTKELTDGGKKAVDNFLDNSKIINSKKLIYNHFTDDVCSSKA